ncbi:MAG: sugar ABC transporter permease [Clostridiales bacterium]|nr:sugar ABC transporter permease [Clostridiales bacterium]
MRRRNAGWIALFLLPTVALFLVIYALPLVITLFTSLYDYRLFPNRMDFVGLQNYINLFTKDSQFHRALANNLIWIVIHTTVHIALGAILALILYKKPRGWKAVRVIYMIPSIISNAAVAMIFANIYNPSYGVLNSFLRGVGLPALQRNWLYDPATSFISVTLIWTLFSGYNTTLILSQALSLDDGVLEAAKVDGANRLQQDFFIVLPLVKPMIATTMIMAATYMLQMFDLIYLTTRGGPGVSTTNLPLMLYKTAMTENNYGYANTIGVVIILLGVFFMTLINRLLKTRED